MTKCEYCGRIIETIPFKCKFCNLIYCEEHRIPEEHMCTSMLQPKSVTLKKTHGSGVFYKDIRIKSIESEESQRQFPFWIIIVSFGSIVAIMIFVLLSFL
ncbi:MAG: AN1-type zinc finger protein [Promethearchaeota archaeon]